MVRRGPTGGRCGRSRGGPGGLGCNFERGVRGVSAVEGEVSLSSFYASSISLDGFETIPENKQNIHLVA